MSVDNMLWLRNTENFLLCDASDLDFDLMILTLKLDLDVLLAYLHATSEVNRSSG